MPQRMAMMMPGQALQLSPESVDALKELKEGNIQGAMLACEDKINLKTKFDKGVSAADIVKAIPDDAPRYLFARWPGLVTEDEEQKDIVFFIYTVPVNASPKSKAPYMGTKMTLLNSLEEKTGLKVGKRVEVDDANLLEKRVKESLEGNEAVANMVVAPEKKISMAKGAEGDVNFNICRIDGAGSFEKLADVTMFIGINKEEVFDETSFILFGHHRLFFF